MLNIIFGIVSGIISGMGIGGGAILITLLICFENIDQKIAQGINFIFFIPTAIIATIINIKYKRINKKVVVLFSIIGSLFAFVGALISSSIDNKVLKRVFAIFLLIMAIYESIIWYKNFIKKDNKENNEKEKRHNNKRKAKHAK